MTKSQNQRVARSECTPKPDSGQQGARTRKVDKGQEGEVGEGQSKKAIKDVQIGKKNNKVTSLYSHVT